MVDYVIEKRMIPIIVFMVRKGSTRDKKYEMIRYITNRDSHRKSKKVTFQLKEAFNYGYASVY